MRRLASMLPMILFVFSIRAQKAGWQSMDLKNDSVFGISVEKAYKELIRAKPGREVIVAVIDMGIDTTHQSLRAALWRNPHEIPGNGIDDDGNGYIDDIYGWNFLDMMNGRQDVAWLAMKDKDFYDSLSYSEIPPAYQANYQMSRKAIRENRNERAKIARLQTDLMLGSNTLDEIVKKIGKKEPVTEDFRKFLPESELEKIICNQIIQTLPLYKDLNDYKQKNIREPLQVLQYQLNYGLNIDADVSSTSEVKGDNDVTGPFLLLPESSSFHGSSVAGILAGDRSKVPGVFGIADHIKVMTLRVVSFFQEMKDAQMAEAIRYAVNNGAKIINFSLSSSFSLRKPLIDEAVKYAMLKDVLIVKAAGNDGIDLDKSLDYPNRNYAGGEQAEAWINVGASSWKDDSALVPAFSNYGKTMVDVFAPGNELISCVMGSKYAKGSGTSLAAPVVSGLAALIWEYYPKLHATQIKNIILQSVVKVDHSVWVKDEKGNKVLLPFKELCRSGGIVNAYNALKLATTY